MHLVGLQENQLSGTRWPIAPTRGGAEIGVTDFAGLIDDWP